MIMASNLGSAAITRHGHSEVRLQCPRCAGWIGHLPDTHTEDTSLICPDCYLKLTCEHGIWRSLLPERSAHFFDFIQEDQRNLAEGSENAEYYLALPYRDLSGRDSQRWALRSRTFQYIKRHILPDIEPKHDGQLRILDLGAGVGWLSYRLALEGHAPIAADLLTNDHDGLGAALHYKKNLTTLFPRFQAEFNTLPFVDDSFDLVIYNASFHCSENYERSLAEALRCTRADGIVLIAETPWYSAEMNSPKMLTARREACAECNSLSLDTFNSLEYLTDQRLQHMEASFGIHWQIHTPNYGVHRLMRQVLSRLHGNQEQSQLRIYSAKARK